MSIIHSNLGQALSSVPRTMKVAVEGCCHGQLDNIYSHIASLERKQAHKVDLLLICGDFQAIRNHDDLLCMAVPQKYRRLGEFYKYYIGEKTAPVLTIAIGGNHEASNYLWELYHGGWLAPNIYYLGGSGCARVNGMRIAGSSGIYKPGDYTRGHYERLPYDQSALRSIYHTRQYDVFKLAQLSSPNIFLSHDWPNTIEQHGDVKGLLRCKPFFRQEIQSSSLGSPPMLDLLKRLKPQWWFSAHLHVKFQALFHHGEEKPKGLSQNNPDEILIDDVDEEGTPSHPDGDKQESLSQKNPDEIVIDDEAPSSSSSKEIKSGDKGTSVMESSNHVELTPGPPRSSNKENTETRFLALDKCLPKRDFLEVVDIPAPESNDPPVLTFDPEWLAITRALHPFLCTTKQQVPLPKVADAQALVVKELEWVRSNVKDGGLCKVDEVQKFSRTAPGPSNPSGNPPRYGQPRWYTNPQTEALTQMLQIENKINPVPAGT